MLRTLSLAAVAASALAASAHAAPASPRESVVIDIAGVNFSDPAQAEAVYDKVLQASRDVCAELYLDAPVREVDLAAKRPLYATCVKDTVDGAVETANQPALTQLNAAIDVEAAALASK
jgi:UrcA family protein